MSYALSAGLKLKGMLLTFSGRDDFAGLQREGRTRTSLI
jgi:hypothetical protein